MKDPKHLAKGWVDYNFNKPLGKPTRVMNDAAMQALGSYRGGRMLFLDWVPSRFDTGLAEKTCFRWSWAIYPTRAVSSRMYWANRVLSAWGKKVWEREVLFCIAHLKLSFIADYVMLGGGNAKLLSQLPQGIELAIIATLISVAADLGERTPHGAAQVECDLGILPSLPCDSRTSHAQNRALRC